MGVMATDDGGDFQSKVPLLLLKTKSTPSDAYEELFSTSRDGLDFEPTFVPVLQHRFEPEGMTTVGGLLQDRRINGTPESSYGGLIFTSQRAVEAFARLVEEGAGRTTPNLHRDGRLLKTATQATTAGRTYRTCPSTASALRRLEP